MALNTCFVPPLDLSTVCIHPWNSRNLPLKHCSLSPTFRTCQVTGKTKRNISITRKQEVQSFSHSYSTDLSNLALYVCVCVRACVHVCVTKLMLATTRGRQCLKVPPSPSCRSWSTCWLPAANKCNELSTQKQITNLLLSISCFLVSWG